MKASVDVERDAPIWFLFVGLAVLLVSGSVDAPRWFAAGLVLSFAAFAYLAFRQITSLPIVPVLVIASVMAAGLSLVFAFEHRDVADGTFLGFHPATAALVYVIWIPGYFTVGVVSAWLSKRREEEVTA